MPSCTRAPPESLMKTKGDPVLSAWRHDLGDLGRVDLAGRAAHHGEVLAGEVDQASVDRGGAGHHAVGRHLPPGHAEQRGAVLGEQAELLEALRVDQRVDPLAGRQLAGLALSLLFVGAASERDVFAPGLQFFHLRSHRVRHAEPGLSPSWCGRRPRRKQGSRAAVRGPAGRAAG